MSWLGSYGSTGQFCCTWWQELHPPGGWLARVATSGNLAETAGRLASAGMAGPLSSPSPSPCGLHSRITLLSTCHLSSPKCKGLYKNSSSQLAYFLFCLTLFMKMSHRASPLSLWEEGLHKGVNTGRHGWLGLSLKINYYIDQYILLLEFQIYSTPLPHF